MSESDPPSSGEISLRRKVQSIRRILEFRPLFTVLIVIFGVLAALLEGVGLGFLAPIIQIAQSDSPSAADGGLAGAFVRVYDTLGIPFSLEWVIVGVALAMSARFTASFGVAWLREKLRREYVGSLRRRAFDAALDARIEYFDEHGSDEMLNAVITQTDVASKTIKYLVKLFEKILLVSMYLLIALYFAPLLTVLTVVLLAIVFAVVRYGVEPAFVVGDRVAAVNEEIQTTAQEGLRGIRAVKLFGMNADFSRRFSSLIDRFVTAKVTLRRNDAAVQSGQQLLSALVIFTLIYAAIRATSLSLGELGVFLFAMFRLAPLVSNGSQLFYQLEGDLPHVVRTEAFIEELDRNAKPDPGTASPSAVIDSVQFDGVSFSYGDSRVLHDVSFDIDRGEFAVFTGPSGAGKSTIVSLVARLYDPESGRIMVNGRSIDEFSLDAWRSRIAVVRQDPFVFSDTLRYNLTLGDTSITDGELQSACEAAQLSELLGELPDGYDTQLGEDGVQLSGGQRQRVALARALLRDVELLVLDEATSDLDATLESKVHEAIQQQTEELTVIMVSHRLSPATDADHIYTMRDGRIVERGVHTELLQQNGTYAELYALQSTEPALDD
ncbi:MAG: ABC transporter ATP-binding protein [Halorubrum sp.]|uniref:ABC transporter ATP-binding protein n=1 Tax=Halorubrum sp. TaxID=1879286 RepID=UPI003970D706